MSNTANASDVSNLAGYETSPTDRTAPGPALLIYVHIAVCCVSLAYVSCQYQYFFNASLEGSRFWDASFSVLFFSLLSLPFTLARFSFGYFVSFYLYTIMIGFVWLSYFTPLSYDHVLARISAALSLVGFLLPSLFVTSPLKPAYKISVEMLDRILYAILVLAAIVVGFGASHNFRLASIQDIYNFRDDLQLPTALQYLIGICTGALLPFSFACFVATKRYWLAALALALVLLFFPITLTKLTLFAPAWLVGMAVLSRYFDGRSATVLSLFVPVLIGVVLVALLPEQGLPYFASINFRMMAIPSSALDYYAEYFSRNELTYFCQISFLKAYTNCPYDVPLSIVMARAYNLGNFNASLFATEGVASVGLTLAPVSAVACGFVFAVFNCVSSRLPPRFILVSGAMLPQIFLNVPLTTALLTNGAAILLLLWCVVPNSIFERS